MSEARGSPETPNRLVRLRPYLRGAVAMACALAVVWGLGRLLRAVPYPPAAIGTILITLAPGAVATQMIEALGHWALRLLVIGVHLVVLGFGGFLARFARGGTDDRARARRALGTGGLLFAIAILLSFAAPGGFSLLTPLIYAAAAIVFVRIAGGVRLGLAFEPELREGETPLDAVRRSRRRFLVRAGAALGGFVVGAAGTVRFFAGRSRVSLRIAPADDPFDPPAPDPDFPEVSGISPEVTSNRDFYTVDINIVKPVVDHRTWSLRVHGLVERPYALDYRTLQQDFQVVEMAHTLTCISNEVGGDLISTAVWRGVMLREVLERAGLQRGVVDVVFRAAEGYTDSIPLAKALEETTLVVFGMNGEALPREHGFPARIIVPGIYGMKNVKWLTEIEPVDHDYQGYWMVRGWSDVATVKTQSRIDAPRGGLVPLSSMIGGVAWAGDRQVLAVEVSQDGGATWSPAIMKRALSPLTWRLWAAGLAPGRGERRVLVRATDGAMRLQESRRTDPHPSGAGGLHEVRIAVE